MDFWNVASNSGKLVNHFLAIVRGHVGFYYALFFWLCVTLSAIGHSGNFLTSLIQTLKRYTDKNVEEGSILS